MPQFLRLVAGVWLSTVILAAQTPARPEKKAANNTMSESGQFLWSSVRQSFGNRPQVHFSFGPGTGLMDIDFHPITDKNWPAMASPSPEAVAILEVPTTATIAQLNAAVQTVAAKGGYRLVEVIMRRQ